MRVTKRPGLAILVAFALLLSACAPSATGTSPPSPTGEASPIPTGETVELLFWDSFDGGRAEAVKKLIKQFEAANPNIKIRRELQDFENMKTVIKTALASGTGPDIVQYGSGAGFMGPLIDADLLLPLDKYADQYGWRDRIYKWTFDSTTFDGALYALGHELEYIGIYYNRKIFQDLGVGEPKSFAELVQIADKAKAAGLIPFAFANKPGWPAFHMFSAFANNLAGKEKMESVLFADGKWSDPEFVRAIQLPFVDWNEAGYFIPSPNSLDYDQGNDVFFSGRAAMALTGTWLVGDVLEKAQDFEAGFFALPAIDGGVVLPPGGMGSATMIYKQTKHPNEAAAFLDFMYTQDAAKEWLSVGKVIPPVDFDPASLELPGLFRMVVDTVRANSTASGLGLGYNIDVLTPPEFNTVMSDGFQAVLGGKRTPQEQADALQASKEASR